MEQSLRCNIRACRRNVGEQALVTTCSHIFCVECAEKHRLSGPDAEDRKICPACNGHLQSPDDAVVAHLNLSEEYKTSVLSGLSPSVIMECTGRALSFWAYQANQEEIFQHYVIKTLTEKIRMLNQQFQKTIDDAHVQIESLRDKLRAQNADYDDLRRKYEELGLSYKDKCRRFAQLQELHSKARRKAELGQMEAAASDVVDSSLQLGYCPPDVQFSESTTRRGFYEHRASSPHVGAKHFSVTDRGRGQVPVDVASPVILNEGQAWSKAGLPTGPSRTPRGTPRREDLRYRPEYTLPVTSGLNPDAPVIRGSTATQTSNYIPIRQASAARGLGLGLGLSSGVRTSHAGTSSSNIRDIHSQSQVAQRSVLSAPSLMSNV